MADARIFGGAAIRRLRREGGLTQAAMASALDISPSYLNLIEHGQRPLSAALIVRLSERFAFDPARLVDDHGIGGASALRRRLGDPMFADLSISAEDIEEWLAQAPMLAAAFARLYDTAGQGAAVSGGDDGEADAVRLVRLEIERWSNHFADLDTQAELLADELRLANPDLYGAIAERLRSQHQIAIRILPVDVLPDQLRRLDLHARQLQISELLSAPSRTFQAAVMLGQLEAKAEIDALVAGARLTDRGAMRLFRRHLAHYFAAALLMPYGRFLRACEATGYDLSLLERRFNVGFEQLAHRLTTMQRVGARGLPFFMLRVDRAGQVSKRYAGASGSPMVDGAIRCARWHLHEAFERPGQLLRDNAELEDGSRWITWCRSVESPARDKETGESARFAIAVGLEARLAPPISAATMRSAQGDVWSPVGLGCLRCARADCIQRGQPPRGRTLTINERERGIAAFGVS